LTSFKDRNGIITTLGYFTNLSDVKNEDEIKSIKKQFTTLLGNSGLILVTLSPDYLISDMNEKAESTFKWDRKETLGKNLFKTIVSQEKWKEISSDIQERLNTQASVGLETQTILNDKTKHSYLWNLVKEIDPKDETVQGFLAVGRDVTALKNAQNKLRESEFILNSTVDKAVLLEEKLKENEKKLKENQDQYEKTLNAKQYQFKDILKYNEKQKMALREEKLNMVEHIASAVVDLVNNPIQGIGNILGQVKKQAEMADIHKGLVTVAINECRRVADLISKLKSFQPPTKKNLESLNIHQILDEIIQNHMDTFNARTITLEKNYTNALPAIDGITPQIRQAINNIVNNAEESLSEDEGKIIISTEQDGSNLKIHISDTGCGISEADMDRIFDPFYTTKSALHRPGLGLLTSLGIVKNHKGEIDVHSEPGEGTTFTVTLPLKQPLNKNGGS
jgi:PAS domain S-box-containing protein